MKKIKLILLYLNTSAYKVSKSSPLGDGCSTDHAIKGFSFALITGLEAGTLLLIDYFCKTNFFSGWLIPVLILFHAAISIIYEKDITQMVNNYYSYYKVALLLLFIAAAMIGIGSCFYFSL